LRGRFIKKNTTSCRKTAVIPAGTVLKEKYQLLGTGSPGILWHEFRHPFFPHYSGKLFYAALLANNSKIINNVTKDCYVGLY